MYYIVNMNSSERRINTAFASEDDVIITFGSRTIMNHFMESQDCILEWQDDDDLIGDDDDTVLMYKVEEFDTEIIYDESGIQVGETSARLPILEINHD